MESNQPDHCFHRLIPLYRDWLAMNAALAESDGKIANLKGAIAEFLALLDVNGHRISELTQEIATLKAELDDTHNINVKGDT